tara:strand:+ start:154 stop:447 length:294 start_codon:yes stop_codon:yes gene_type:complete
MSEQNKKFTEEEMKELQNIQQKYIDIQNSLGQLSMARIKVNKQLEALDLDENDLLNEFDKVREGENKFVDGIREKYGDGQLNPETGEFTPSNSVEKK